MTSLRVLHVTPYSPDAWAYGGIPRLTATLTRELASRGHDVTLCTTDARDEATRLPRPTLGSRRRPWPSEILADGVRRRVFPNLSNTLAYRWQFFTPLGLRRYLREHARMFDIAHLHACRNLPGAIAARQLTRAGVPYVVAPNGTAPRIERRRFAKRMFDLVAARGFLENAAGVLAVSNAERRQLTALGIPAARIHLLPNPVDMLEFTPPPARGVFRQRLGILHEPLIVFLGQVAPRKRVDLLVRAFAHLNDPSARLVIAGNDMGALTAARELVSSLGLESRALFTDLLKGRERLELLSDADVVAYPSEHEVFGLVPLEALLAGTPVIVADDCGCGDIVRQTGGGLVVSAGHVDALTQALKRMLHERDAWRRTAVEAAGRVRAAYDGRVVGAALADLYRSLLTR